MAGVQSSYRGIHPDKYIGRTGKKEELNCSEDPAESLFQLFEECINFHPVNELLLFHGIGCIEDGIRLVAILVEKCPAHLLLAPPCYTARPNCCVSRDIYVMPVLLFWGFRSSGPRLAGMEFGQCRIRQGKTKAGTDIRVDRTFNLVMVFPVDLGKRLDLVLLLCSGPAFRAPELDRVKYTEAVFRVPVLLMPFVQYIRIGYRQNFFLLGISEGSTFWEDWLAVLLLFWHTIYFPFFKFRLADLRW